MKGNKMEKQNIEAKPILGFDELFEDGIIVDGTDADLDEVDRIMRVYLQH